MGSCATARSSAAAALLAGCLLGAAPARGADDPAGLPPPSESLPPPAIPRTPAGWETLATGLPEEARLRLLPAFRYNRVDGATPGAGAAFRNERDVAPLVYAMVSYATGRDRFLGAAGFEAPIGDPARLRAGADAYRRTATEDAWIVGELENTLFALVARTDYRDHYEATGVAGRVIWEPGKDAALEAGVRIQNEASLPTRVRFSVFGKDDRFRANPPIEPGDEGLLSVSARIGPARFPPRGGAWGTLGYERAGGFLERDFDYGRLRASARVLHRFTPRQAVRGRALAGSTREGRLPLQKLWHVGGIGTLRGHDYKAFTGDQFFLVNAEYLVRVRKNLFPFAFVDWGAAWFGAGNLDRQRPGLDLGVGLRVGEDPAAITVARDMRRADAPLRVGVRFGGSF
jgi:hypothetical protein